MNAIKIIHQNKKAFHEFQIHDRTEAGIALSGTEVKALRAGKVNLQDGWIDIDGSDAFMRDCHIGHYSHGNIHNHLEKRPRRLLLSKKEMIKLESAASTQGFTILPLKIYFKNGWIKLEIGLAKSKKLHDKREDAKKRSAMRDIRAAKTR